MLKDGKLTKADLIKEIKRQNRKGIYKGYLGFVENKDLTDEVLFYFSFKNKFGVVVGYDWVNGNDYLKELEKEVKQ